jgi:hypothetical protein
MITNITAVPETNGNWRVAFDMQQSLINGAPIYWLVLTNGRKEFRSLLNETLLQDETSDEYREELSRATRELMEQAGLSDELS